MILVFNAGSSSLKVKLFSDHMVIYSRVYNRLKSTKDFRKSVSDSFNFLLKEGYKEKIKFIAHRVVHGGNLESPYKIRGSKELGAVSSLNDFAPLHNPKAVEVIKLCHKLYRGTDEYIVFDTAFFHSLPDVSRVFAINPDLAKKYQLQKYGFHGISHQFVVDKIDPSRTNKLISLHLGAGCSIAAIDQGRPIDTSMSFTPLDGLIMQTRSGAIDPGVVLFLCRKFGVKEADNILNKKSGLSGLTGTDGDMRQILFLADCPVSDQKFMSQSHKSPSNSQAESAKFAIEKYCYEIKKFIAAYNFILGGADKVVFTGQIGYGSSYLREKIIAGFDFNKNQIQIVEPNEELAIEQLIRKEVS